MRPPLDLIDERQAMQEAQHTGAAASGLVAREKLEPIDASGSLGLYRDRELLARET